MVDLVIRGDRVVTPLGVGEHDVLIAGEIKRIADQKKGAVIGSAALRRQRRR